MRDYGKVHTSFWSSATIQALSEDGRTLALYLMTCPHSTIAGVFRLPDGYICEDMRWTPERVAKGFAELSANGWAKRCETTKWVWIVKHLEWNPPENPNQRIAVAKVARGTPDECGWKQEFMRVCGVSAGLEQPAPTNPSATVPEPLPNQEQDQKQKQKGSAKARSTTLPDGFAISDRVRAWADEKGHTNLQPHFDALVSYARRKGAKYADWDEALMTAVRDDWGKTGSKGGDDPYGLKDAV